MITRICLFLIIACAIVDPDHWQDPDAGNIARKYSLQEPVTHRVLVADAIALANAALTQSVGISLTPAWSSNPRSALTVYIVSGSSLNRTETPFVPARERCVFVPVDGIDALLKKLAGYKKAGLDVHPEEALALILLHETGHLYYHDSGGEGTTLPFSLADLDKPRSSITNKELRADLFAVAQIHNSFRPKTSPEKFDAAMKLSLLLTDVSWNLFSQRMLGDFGGTTLNKPGLFLDQDGTHPNFELRFIVMEYAMHHSKAAKDMLTSFIQHREKAAAQTGKPGR